MPLSGTLTIPKGKGPFPAVVLVHGSGPNDRDESIGPNMPFRDIAWGLASKGIAVLRYEKRTKEYGEQVVKLIDSLTINEETVNDAVDAAEMLSKNPSIKPDKIFILGHSLGAMSAPRIGSHFKNTAGLIIMAGTDRQIQDLYIEQIEYLSSLNGKPDPASQEKINSIKEQVKLVNSDRFNKNTPRDSLPMNLPAKYWMELKSYSPAATLMTLNTPALIMQGERDYQVDMKSYKRWQEKLAGRKNTDYKLYPKLNHLFIEGEGKPNPEEYGKESHVPDYVINDIYTWISSK
jgi:dienelactone hydrolase